MITVVIPVFRDADALRRTLETTDFRGCELIVATTADDRASLAPLRPRWPDAVWIEAARGRARQMNAGAAAARGRWIVFLHADTHLPPGWRRAIDAADRDGRVVAGCFRFALDSGSVFARLIEAGVRLRVRLFGLPYGDQALFVRRDVFGRLGGYADIPIMEDVDLVRRLRPAGRLFRSALPAVTSARRWRQQGWVRRSARNLSVILLYFAGMPPTRLVHLYNDDGATRAGPPASKGMTLC